VIDADKIQRAAEDMHAQFVSHPPHRSSFLGGFHAGAVWAEHELQPEPVNTRLLTAAKAALPVMAAGYLTPYNNLRAAIADAERALGGEGGA